MNWAQKVMAQGNHEAGAMEFRVDLSRGKGRFSMAHLMSTQHPLPKQSNYTAEGVAQEHHLRVHTQCTWQACKQPCSPRARRAKQQCS